MPGIGFCQTAAHDGPNCGRKYGKHACDRGGDGLALFWKEDEHGRKDRRDQRATGKALEQKPWDEFAETAAYGAPGRCDDKKRQRCDE